MNQISRQIKTLLRAQTEVLTANHTATKHRAAISFNLAASALREAGIQVEYMLDYDVKPAEPVGAQTYTYAPAVRNGASACKRSCGCPAGTDYRINARQHPVCAVCAAEIEL